MRRAAQLFAALTLATACSQKEPPPVPPPGIPGAVPIDLPAEAAKQRVAPGDPTRWGNPLAAATPTPSNEGSAPSAEAAENTAPVTPEPVRDLSEELVGLVGAPNACFSKRTAAAGATFSFQVTAAVTPTGMITRAEVTGGGLSAEEADCVKARVASARFRSPVENAPLSIQATVELRAQAPQEAATP